MANYDLIKEIISLWGTTPDTKKLTKKIQATIENATRKEKELNALMNSARAVLEEKSFLLSARSIFDHCRDLVGATSGYVALLDDTGMENEVLFL